MFILLSGYIDGNSFQFQCKIIYDKIITDLSVMRKKFTIQIMERG